MNGKVEEELIGLAIEWDRAMVENNAEAIGRYMADDWTIIGSDGSIGDKATFLGLVKSGTLSHNVMESDDFRVRLYGEVAVVTARGCPEESTKGRHFAKRSGYPVSSSSSGGNGSASIRTFRDSRRLKNVDVIAI